MKISILQSESFTSPRQSNRVNSNSPSFGIANSGKLKTLFTYGLPCMYTGVEMIDPRRVQRLLNNKSFEIPAAQVLGVMKPFEKSIIDVELKVYNIIKDIVPRFPDKNLQGIFKILAPNYKSSLKSEQLPVLKEISETAKELPEDYQYKFQHFLSETEDKINEKPIFMPFSSYEFKYKLDKIREDISQNGSLKANKVMNKLVLEASRLPDETDERTLESQTQILKFLKIILKSSVLKKNPQLKNLINESQKRLNNESLQIPFSRKSFIYDLKNLVSSLQDEDLKDRLLNLAIKLPSSRDSVSAYILKFSREPSWKIAYRILWPNLASVEHILPQSKGGKDEMANFGGAGTRVNAERGNIDFTEQIEKVPDTAKNSQKYVDVLTQLVRKGVFHRNGVSTSYIDSFSKTINEQSLGKINLDTTELREYRIKGGKLLGILSCLLGK